MCGLAGSLTAVLALALVISKFKIRFRNREAAANILGDILKSRLRNAIAADSSHRVTVLGIPRGGVIIADTIARKLLADFDILIAAKLGEPVNREKAIGAIVEDGTSYLQQTIVGTTCEHVEMEKSEQKEEIERLIGMYRGPKRLLPNRKIRDRTVILVDDGAATGATVIAASRSVRKQNPTRLIIALPVAPRHIINLLKAEADEVEVLLTPSSSEFVTVGQFYQDFVPVHHEKVIEILKTRNLLQEAQ